MRKNINISILRRNFFLKIAFNIYFKNIFPHFLNNIYIIIPIILTILCYLDIKNINIHIINWFFFSIKINKNIVFILFNHIYFFISIYIYSFLQKTFNFTKEFKIRRTSNPLPSPLLRLLNLFFAGFTAFSDPYHIFLQLFSL